MKKALLPLAIAAVMPMSAMAMGPIDGKIYGKMVVTADSVEEEVGSTTTEDEWQLNSNASRIGVKGKSELSEGLYAIYKAEFEIYIDDGQSSSSKGKDTFEQRNIYVGLTGSAGTIIAGKHDTPTKLAQKKIDLFGDLAGDIKSTFEGENRESNIAIYTTPKFSGFSGSIAAVASEGEDVDGDGKDDDGFDGTSLSVNYSNDDLYLALAADNEIDGQDLVRAVAQYKIGSLQLGFMYQDTESVLDSSNSSYFEEDGFFLSAKYGFDKVVLRAQYGEVEGEDENNLDYEEETFSLGVDYKLAKKTKVFAYYTQNTDDSVVDVETEETVFGFGMEHKF
jgi:predicted porin